MTSGNKILIGAGIIGGIIILSTVFSNRDTETGPVLTPDTKTQQNNIVVPFSKSIVPKTEPRCHPSYSGACLNPNASDYDCAGGSGNGPYYTGTVRVVGPDVFGLDRDRDGWGCE